MSELNVDFPEIPLADIEARAQQLIEAYEDHAGKRVRTPIPVEAIASSSIHGQPTDAQVGWPDQPGRHSA